MLICASPGRVRSLLVAAHRLGLVNSGQYVFVSVEDPRLSSFQPWEEKGATEEENQEALDAFQAMLTLSLRGPLDYQAHFNFTQRVEEIAKTWFNHTLKDGVNSLASGFYDAALLYARGDMQNFFHLYTVVIFYRIK